jgi:hypothetical protein
MAGKIRMGQGVAFDRAVPLAIGKIFEDCRNRVGIGILGQPDPRGESRMVRELDENILDLDYLSGKVPDHSHLRPCSVNVLAKVVAWPRALQSNTATNKSAADCLVSFPPRETG